jgi:hypothetical protein
MLLLLSARDGGGKEISGVDDDKRVTQHSGPEVSGKEVVDQVLATTDERTRMK